jgi:hypothetical protein
MAACRSALAMPERRSRVSSNDTTAIRRWPRSTRCWAAAVAPPGSSIWMASSPGPPSAPRLGTSSTSTKRHSPRAGRLQGGVVVGEAVGDETVHDRVADQIDRRTTTLDPRQDQQA